MQIGMLQDSKMSQQWMRFKRSLALQAASCISFQRVAHPVDDRGCQGLDRDLSSITKTEGISWVKHDDALELVGWLARVGGGPVLPHHSGPGDEILTQVRGVKLLTKSTLFFVRRM